MRKYILISALVLGLIIIVPTALAQTASRATLIAQLIAQINLLRVQIQLLQQRQTLPVSGQVAGVFYSTGAPIRLEYVEGVGGDRRNVLKPGVWVNATGAGFTSVMKLIINGQAANEQAYTYVSTVYPASSTKLSFLLPVDAPEGTLDLHLADGTVRTSRVSSTLLVETAR